MGESRVEKEGVADAMPLHETTTTLLRYWILVGFDPTGLEHMNSKSKITLQPVFFYAQRAVMHVDRI